MPKFSTFDPQTMSTTMLTMNKNPPDSKVGEFLIPSMQAPRRSLTTRSSEMNYVAVLTETRATRSANEGFRLLLASAKHVVSGVKPHDVISPVTLLTELAKVTSLLDGYNEILVDELFKCNILALEDAILTCYLKLLVEMARSNSFYHGEVCRLLLRALTTIESEDAPEEKISQIHGSFQTMIKELPRFSESLLKQISRNLPFMTKSWQSQVHFYRSMLELVDYVPEEVSLEVLSRLIHKIIDLDCQCPKEEMVSEDDETQFSMETAEDHAVKEMKHSLGNTFDRLMEVFFEYIDRHVIDVDDLKRTYRKFLTVFDKFILSTYKCLHIQFLLLYICSKRPVITDHFIDFLWHKVQNPNTPVVFRQIAVYYLGSLLCRCSFIGVGTLKDSLLLMTRFLHSYVAQSSSAQSLTVDLSKHGTFYSVCQSVFYCIAFRHKEIIEGDDGLGYLQRLNLEQIVTSPLNPLKVISPAVGIHFANVTRHYQVVYCYAIFERNQRSALPMANPGNQKLDVYFPFDPYVLLRSKRFVEPIYREYVDHLKSSVDEDPEQNNNSSSDSDGEDDEDEEMVSTSLKSAAEKMFAYSVSPGFAH
ncbi:RNA polymerase I-specific transcription initiation factor RRN3 [Galendromus occidentalis]|uniref:RNA polymerase I-specific transcription initiation factor RRN3 n=1 Tax=Galendromus occidentalis TaxID=34638 RepID=A0AAJ6QQR2_9ACAR|nr:RNA polymerase I-specific transcription initiation factor RRN3 [Galendromus occidentalis]